MSRPTVTVERTGLPDWQRSGDYGDIHYDIAEGIAKITIARPGGKGQRSDRDVD